MKLMPSLVMLGSNASENVLTVRQECICFSLFEREREREIDRQSERAKRKSWKREKRGGVGA